MRFRSTILQAVYKSVRIITILAGCFLYSGVAKGQDTIWVHHGDTHFLRKESPLYFSQWDFREGLPDGYYCLYNDTFFLGSRPVPVAREVYSAVAIKNGKKEGPEMLFGGRHDTTIIPWRSGKKNGVVKHFDHYGLLDKYAYKNDKLNGVYEGYSRGVLAIKGSFKNGFCDGIWTKYEVPGHNQKRPVKPAVSVRYRFVNGIPEIIGATKRNGRFVDLYSKGKLFSVKLFKDDRLMSLERYDPDGKIIWSDNYVYPRPARIDTVVTPVSGLSYHLLPYHNEVSRVEFPARHGYCFRFHHKEGTIFYEGYFDSGRVKSSWVCNDQFGRPLVTVDGINNVWKHFDSKGNVISDAKFEYYSLLTDHTWNCYNKLGDSELVFDRHIYGDYQDYRFQPDGLFKCNECTSGDGYYRFDVCHYRLIADTLKVSKYRTTYSYKIVAADDGIVRTKLVHKEGKQR